MSASASKSPVLGGALSFFSSGQKEKQCQPQYSCGGQLSWHARPFFFPTKTSSKSNRNHETLPQTLCAASAAYRGVTAGRPCPSNSANKKTYQRLPTSVRSLLFFKVLVVSKVIFLVHESSFQHSRAYFERSPSAIKMSARIWLKTAKFGGSATCSAFAAAPSPETQLG